MIDDRVQLQQVVVVLRHGTVVIEVQGLQDGQEPVSGHDRREQACLQYGTGRPKAVKSWVFCKTSHHTKAQKSLEFSGIYNCPGCCVKML